MCGLTFAHKLESRWIVNEVLELRLSLAPSPEMLARRAKATRPGMFPARGLCQTEFAQVVGATQAQVSRWEAGKHAPRG